MPAYIHTLCRAEKRHITICIIIASKKKNCSEKKNPWKKIFLPVCALMHFSVSWAYSFI